MFRTAVRLTRQLSQKRRLGSFIRHAFLPSFWRDRKQPRPIFLMGPAANGSTWIGAMLGHLPNHVFVHEVKISGGVGLRMLLGLQRLRKVVPGRLLFVLLENLELARLWTIDAHHTDLKEMRPELLAPENLKSFDPAHAARNYREYSVVDTSGSKIMVAPLLRKAYPNAILCYIARDPRDVCISIKHRKVFGGAHEMDGWARTVLKTYENYEKYRDECGIDLLRYESWLRDAAGELAAFVERHDLKMSPELQAEAVLQHDAAAMKAGKTPRKGNLKVAQASGWSKNISPAEKESLKTILGSVLIQFGYEASREW